MYEYSYMGKYSEPKVGYMHRIVGCYLGSHAVLFRKSIRAQTARSTAPPLRYL